MIPFEQQVRERAYYIWEGEGRVFGRAEDHWLMAEAELVSTRDPAPHYVQAATADLSLSPSPAKVLKPRASRSAAAKAVAEKAVAEKAVAAPRKPRTSAKSAATQSASAKVAAPKAPAAKAPATKTAAAKTTAAKATPAARPRAVSKPRATASMESGATVH
ncbi:DUF2934 domain-containing protein [Methylobacterium sp. E-045]|uniref:DUF2934 domain-containing protein n=1 Tax=Methylobacterium sp. E-045 TaxID=2836575 RepID=UPI001FB93A6F|nr:DUF2934 domain-containing protein [Methylobacterium sp. E-045]MCJ2131521.1 DUF2934 domain-containing protein [Methylobacterium sp. E-045]